MGRVLVICYVHDPQLLLCYLQYERRWKDDEGCGQALDVESIQLNLGKAGIDK
jgi:hypothetical protein